MTDPGPHRTAPRRRRVASEGGVALLEVIVALAILSTVLVSLSGMMWQMGRQTRLSGTAAYRTAAVESGAALVLSVPWDSIDAMVGCAADTSGTLAYDRCISVTGIADGLKRVRVVVTPTSAYPLTPETLAVFRNRPLVRSPLNVQ